MDFNIVIRDNVQSPGLEHTGFLHKGSSVIGQTRAFVDQVQGCVCSPLPLTAIVQATDYTTEEHFFKVSAGDPANVTGEVHGWHSSCPNNVEGSQVTIVCHDGRRFWRRLRVRGSEHGAPDGVSPGEVRKRCAASVLHRCCPSAQTCSPKGGGEAP